MIGSTVQFYFCIKQTVVIYMKYSYVSGVLKRVYVDEVFGSHMYRSEIKALEVKEVSKGRNIHKEKNSRPVIKAKRWGNINKYKRRQSVY